MKKINICFEPNKLSNQSLYEGNNKFNLDILYYLLEKKHSLGHIVIDGYNTKIGLVNVNTLEEVSSLNAHVKTKHNKGCQSAQRFERLRENFRVLNFVLDNDNITVAGHRTIE